MDKKKGLFTAFLGLFAGEGIVNTAIAQDTNDSVGTARIEEIVVTSRRYEERITDAPLAVSVMSEQYLADNRVDSIQDVLELVPGSNWGQFAKAQPDLGMRGINGSSFGNASLEHAVSVVSDGVPITKAFMMTIPVYDMQRVEVLRGPQGTTFGRNATLGMMHFISARPSQESSAAITSSIGERDLFEVSGHINGALNEDWSARLAVNYGDTPGAMEDTATGDMLEYAENLSFRASFLYEPSDTFSAYLKAEYIDDEEFPTVRRGRDGGGLPWLNVANYEGFVDSANPWQATISPDPDGAPWVVERDMTFLTAELSWALDNDISLTSITGYQDGSHYSNSDAFGTPWDIRDQTVWNDANLFSQEVRIDNQSSGNVWRWLVGASYLTDEEDRLEFNESEPFRDNCNASTPTACFRNSTLWTDASNTTDAYGIFGEVTWDISDRLTLAVGGRYSNDSRDLSFSTFGYGAAGGLGGVGLGNDELNSDGSSRDCADYIDPVTMAQLPCGTEDNPVGFDATVSDSWSDFSTKFSLSYALNDNNNIYALYSEGFKGGGFQQDARSENQLVEPGFIVDRELATNVELGWKGSYDNLVFAITAFRQEQDDVQTGQLAAIGSSQVRLLFNANGIVNKGIEIEGTWAATDNLTLGGYVAKYNPEYKSGSLVARGFDPDTGEQTGGEEFGGETPLGSVEEAWTLFATYDWALPGGSTISLRGDYRHRGEIWGQDGFNNRTGLTIDGTTQHNLRPELDKYDLRLSWLSADENLGVSLWGRNLDDEPDYINFGPGFGYLYNLGAPGDNPSTDAIEAIQVRSTPVGSTGRKLIGATLNYHF